MGLTYNWKYIKREGSGSMKEVQTIKELVDYAYLKYKSRRAVSMNNGYIRNINYFNYRFDIYSLARAISTKISDKNVGIILENRYEFLVTFFANIILKNTIIIIDENLSQKNMANIIKKYNIKTIFFSNKSENKILEIYKNNTKKKKLNLINFDSNNRFPIIEFEKLINIGRYIENYSTDDIPDTKENIKNIIIANLEGIKAYSQQDFLKSAYIIGKNIKLKRRRGTQTIILNATFFQILIKIILPVLYGSSVQLTKNNSIENKYNIDILEENKNRVIVQYKNNRYLIENVNIDTYVRKVEESLLKKEEKETINFILIKSNKRKEANENKKSISI